MYEIFLIFVRLLIDVYWGLFRGFSDLTSAKK